jgi:hypothetical protein
MRPLPRSILRLVCASSLVVGCEPSATPTPPLAPVMSATPPSGSLPTSSSPSASANATADAGLSRADTSSTLFVAEDTVACEGEGPRTCLRVRSSESAPWRLFYGTIEGFTREPHTAYELRVVTADAGPERADAPASRYRLVDIVSKRKAASPNKNSTH